MQRREFGEMTVTDMPSKTALSRSLNPLQLILLILSSTTPMAAVVGLMPLSFAFGASTGVPLTFVIATIVLLFFSVGYTTIARSIRGAGCSPYYPISCSIAAAWPISGSSAHS